MIEEAEYIFSDLVKANIPHTDWCGPNKSDGTHQKNNIGYATSRSALDQCCKEHDTNLTKSSDKYNVYDADGKFFSCSAKIGLLPTIVGVAPLVKHLVTGESTMIAPSEIEFEFPQIVRHTTRVQEGIRKSLRGADYGNPLPPLPGEGPPRLPKRGGDYEPPEKPKSDPPVCDAPPSHNRIDDLINKNTNNLQVAYNPYSYPVNYRRRRLKNYKASRFWL